MIIYIIKCGIKLLNNLRNSNCAAVEILEWMRNLIHTPLGMWLLNHAGFTIIPC